MSGQHGKENRGACAACRLVLHWRAEPRLCDALCPRCKSPLQRVKPSTRGEHVNEHPATRPPSPVLACMECGRKFRTVQAAETAAFGVDGCPRCGSSDIQESA